MINQLPKCPRCGEGVLLPFFNRNGANIYACTKCGKEFGPDREMGWTHLGQITWSD